MSAQKYFFYIKKRCSAVAAPPPLTLLHSVLKSVCVCVRLTKIAFTSAPCKIHLGPASFLSAPSTFLIALRAASHTQQAMGITL
jgi:hypothetical protein